MTRKSEIYAQGYEPWQGERGYTDPVERVLHHPAILIGVTSLRNAFTHSGCLGKTFFTLAFLFPMAIYFFLVVVGSIARFQLDALKGSETFGQIAEALSDALSAASIERTEAAIHMNNVLFPSLIFCLPAMIFYGAQLVSKDKAANALQVYFSKAISRFDYVLGKFLAVGAITSLFTLVPSALILMLGLVLSTNFWEFLQQSWYIPFLSGIYWVILTLILGSVTLFFSACFNKFYMASVGIIGFALFGWVASLLLGFIFGAPDMLTGLNWIRSIWDICHAVYKFEFDSGGLLFWQVVDMGLIITGCLAMLFKKIRPVEVIN